MPVPVNRLIGRYAEASIGGVLIALLFDWEVTVEHDTEDVTAHGDHWQQHVPLDAGWRFRCRGYVVPGSAAHYINTAFGAGPQASFALAGYSGSVATGTLIFAGTGIPIRGILSAPMVLAEQELEFIGVGAPTTGI